MVSVKEKAGVNLSGGKQGDECKRTADEVSKARRWRQNRGCMLVRDKSGGNLLTVQAASGIEAA